MKQLTSTLLFFAVSIFSFAQSAFNEKMLNDHAQRLVANPMKWMKEDVSPNFILSGSEGSTFNYQQSMALFEGVNVLSRELADVKISQYGNVAIATGIVTSKNTIKANGMPLNYHERFTYVLQNQKDKWILMSGQHTVIQPPASEDKPEEIAKQWIAEYSKDNKLFFVKNCSDDFIASNAGIDGGKFFGREFIEKRAENKTSDTETTVNKVFKSGNLAVVIGTLIWHNKQADGSDKPNKVVSTMIMQKKDGKWWYSGHHLSPLKEE